MAHDKVKISSSDFNKFNAAYHSGKLPEDYKHLRFGQGFFYYFKDQGMDTVTDPQLFYETDIATACRLICERYINES